MRIGLLTYHSVCNFGANLQALSTVAHLQQRGCSPIVINWMPKDLQTMLWAGVPEIQAQAHHDFAHQRLPMTPACDTEDDIVQALRDYRIDAVIIGSDAVLKQDPVLSRITFPARRGIAFAKVGRDSLYPNPFWGAFVQKLHRPIPLALMSASSQNAQYRLIPPKTRRHMQCDLRRFGYLSVRDGWTANMVAYLTRGRTTPPVTPDPVFAFNYNVTDQPAKAGLLKRFGLPEKYILLSFSDSRVSSDWINTFAALAERSGILCVALAMPKGMRFAHQLRKSIDVPLCPMDWYALIKHSSGYVGHKMHPIVVALHNSVPFFSFDSYGITCLRIFANEKSSKIFDQLQRAGFPQNRCSLASKIAHVLSPGAVFDRLCEFDRAKCAAFSLECYQQYRAMMDAILGLFEARSKEKGLAMALDCAER